MNVTYGADGYAVRATNYEHVISAGAKKSERAPSVDTARSAADRSGYGGSVCDQRHFSDRELAHAAELREQAASGALTPAQAHRFIEAIRAMYGYSGGSGGNEYAALDLPDERPPETRRWRDRRATNKKAVPAREPLFFCYFINSATISVYSPGSSSGSPAIRSAWLYRSFA